MIKCFRNREYYFLFPTSCVYTHVGGVTCMCLSSPAQKQKCDFTLSCVTTTPRFLLGSLHKPPACRSGGVVSYVFHKSDLIRLRFESDSLYLRTGFSRAESTSSASVQSYCSGFPLLEVGRVEQQKHIEHETTCFII